MTVSSALSHAAKRLAQSPIYLYRYAISPLIGPVCRYQPTCSAYALEAIEKHGAFKGAWLTLRRLARCHPVKWLGGSEGFDPVPECTDHHHAKTNR
ncbi:MAG: membrane protein insertion efficiency factor YidD [Alphaproteobacteria bacterium]|nr:membrane protein insertion efficiency factor YidD [Alphaproteobacteria bacterium]